MLFYFPVRAGKGKEVMGKFITVGQRIRARREAIGLSVVALRLKKDAVYG